MEENKKTKELTHEELKQKFGELYAQYQKATAYIQKLEEKMADDALNQTSFFVSMLFKVMDHPEQYTKEFVSWASQNIMSVLTEFSKLFSSEVEEKKEDKKEDKKDEA